MKLIAGLGNPGLKYSKTRHNAGFMALNTFAKKYGFKINKKKANAFYAEKKINDHLVGFILPQTYMNLSGQSIKAFTGRIDSLKDLLVVYDDIDLSLGVIRLRANGSSAGHNGMKSAIETLNSQDFNRLRIGVRGTQEVFDASKYVLNPFLKKESKTLKQALEKSADAIHMWIKEGIDKAMLSYNEKNK